MPHGNVGYRGRDDEGPPSPVDVEKTTTVGRMNNNMMVVHCWSVFSTKGCVDFVERGEHEKRRRDRDHPLGSASAMDGKVGHGLTVELW